MSSRYNLLSLMSFGFYQNKLSVILILVRGGRLIATSLSVAMSNCKCLDQLVQRAFVFTSPPEQIGALHDSLHFQTLKKRVCVYTDTGACMYTHRATESNFLFLPSFHFFR